MVRLVKQDNFEARVEDRSRIREKRGRPGQGGALREPGARKKSERNDRFNERRRHRELRD